MLSLYKIDNNPYGTPDGPPEYGHKPEISHSPRPELGLEIVSDKTGKKTTDEWVPLPTRDQIRDWDHGITHQDKYPFH